MSSLAGLLATIFGFLGMLAAIIRAARGHEDRAFQNEACAVLWFILAAVLLK